MTTGKDSILGVSTETTWNVRQGAPTSFHRFKTSTLKDRRQTIYDEAIIAGRKIRDSAAVCEGDHDVSGALSLPLFIGTLDPWLTAMIGAPNAGAGTVGDPITWVYQPAELGSLTVSQNPGGTAGVVPGEFTGVKVDSWSIGVQAGGMATLDLDLIGGGFSAAEGVPTPAYTRPRKYTYGHAVATVGGATRKVKAATVSGNNGLTGNNRRFLGNRYIAEPVHEGEVEVMAELNIEFVDATDRDAYLSAATMDEITLGLVFTSGTDILTISTTGIYDESPEPDVNTRGPLESNIVIKAAAADDASAFSITRSNS